MTLARFLLLCLLAAGLPPRAAAQQSADPGPIFDAYTREYYRLDPLSATANGVQDYNDRMAIDISPAFDSAVRILTRRYLDTLATVNYAALSESDRLSVDVFRYRLELLREWVTPNYRAQRPVDQFVFSFPQRFALLGSGAGNIPFQTEKDYRNFMGRMKDFATWVDVAIANMNEGLRTGNVNPKAAMEKVPAQLRPLFADSSAAYLFYKPLQALPTGLDSAAAQRLRADYTATVDAFIRPAYRRLHDYLVATYIPNARTTAGLSGNRNGAAEYAFALRFYTTTRITADEVFALGERE
ncbi:MAG: DUF885 family protein, partial [Chitinophagaceae bacterium]